MASRRGSRPTTHGLRLPRIAAIRRSEKSGPMSAVESATEEVAPALAEQVDQAAEQVAIGLGVTPAAVVEGAPHLRLEPLLASLRPGLLGGELSRPLLAAPLDPGQHPRQLVEVEPDAVGAADVEDDAALAAVVLAVHQGPADRARPIEVAAGSRRGRPHL